MNGISNIALGMIMGIWLTSFFHLVIVFWHPWRA